MKNKTCGECKYFDHKLGICDLTDDFSTVMSDNLACVDYEQIPRITNGDKIRQMSDRELAELITPKVMFCNGCPVKCAEKDIPQRDKNDPFGTDVAGDVCIKRVEQWLESEVEDE